MTVEIDHATPQGYLSLIESRNQVQNLPLDCPAILDELHQIEKTREESREVLSTFNSHDKLPLIPL